MQDMKTILKDKNIKKLNEFLLLSDDTSVVLYTKYDDKQKYVLLDDKEFGPFEKTDLFLSLSKEQKSSVENYYFAGKTFDGKLFCFSKEGELPELSQKNQNLRFDVMSQNAIEYFDEAFNSDNRIEQKEIDSLLKELSAQTKDYVDPYITEKDGYYFFEINNQSFGPFSLICGYAVKDKENFQLNYISPFDGNNLHYMLNGKHITSLPLGKNLCEMEKTRVSYTESGKAIFSNLSETYIYLDGERVDYFDGKCFDIVYFEKDEHFLAIGHLINAPASYWYCFDGKVHKNWNCAKLMENGSPLYIKRCKNRKTGRQEAIWYLGNKRISVPVNAAGAEIFIHFDGSLIFYTRNRVGYVLMNGKEYQGIQINNNYVALLMDDEIKLYRHKNEFDSEESLAEYLAKNNLMAGGGDLPVIV